MFNLLVAHLDEWNDERPHWKVYGLLDFGMKFFNRDMRVLKKL